MEKASLPAERAGVPSFCLELLDGNVPFGVWVCDPSGGVSYVSPSFLEAVGMDMEQCRSHGWVAALAPEDADATVAKWRRCIREDSPWCHEFHIRCRDGSARTVLGRGAKVSGQGGRSVAWAGVNLDITEIRGADEDARREEENRRLTQRMEIIARLAGGVAHDYNNLLTAINGYSELLVEMPDRRPEKVAAYAREILRAGEKAASLTRQLLAFSRRQIQAPRVLDLNEKLYQLKYTLQDLLGGRVQVVVETEAHHACIKADPAQVDQILLNLAFNARDAMPEGGSLRLKTYDAEETWSGERIAEPGESPAHFVALSVQDTGKGMDKESLAHLFEPFYTTKEKSRGLGLPAVYGIVKQNCGHIAIHSGRGQGTDVRIYWPLYGQGS